MEVNLEKLVMIQHALPGFADDVVIHLGERVIEEVQSGWSAESPSQAGEAPAIVSGELAASLEIQHVGSGNVLVGSHAAHAAPLEFGTHDMAARPFLRPAVERVRPEMNTVVKERFPHANG